MLQFLVIHSPCVTPKMAPFFELCDYVVLVVTACIVLYLFLTKHKNTWKKQGIAYESLSLIFRPLYQLLIKPVDLPDQERYQKYGRLFGFFEAAKPCLMVAEPDLVKQVLVKDFNLLPNRMEIDFGDPVVNNMMIMVHVERWRKIRPASSPAFSTGKLRKMFHLVQECVKITCNHLEEAAGNEEDTDMKEVYSHYALDVIARCAFGTKVDSYTDTANQFVTASQEALGMGFSPLQLLSMLFPGLLKTLRIEAKAAAPFEYFRQLFRQIMAEREEKMLHQEDFLQLMIDAKQGHFAMAAESSIDAESKLFNIGSEANSEPRASSNALTEDEALAQCVAFFLAGQDTTASTLAAAAYYLALNPQVQEKLRKEVDECFEAHGPEPSLDVTSKLKYLHCIVSETLRLLPPAPRTQRVASTDYVLGETAIKVPKGCTVVIPIYSMHHDAEFFPEPERFDPDRFAENGDIVRPYTYIPFGAGPRNCIGMRLALLSVKLCLLHCVHRVQFVCTQETRVPLQIKEGYGTLRVEGTVVGIRKRPTA